MQAHYKTHYALTIKLTTSTHDMVIVMGLNHHLNVFYDKPVKTLQAHYKTHSPEWTSSKFRLLSEVCFMVDLAGFAPASKTLFSLLHTTI